MICHFRPPNFQGYFWEDIFTSIADGNLMYRNSIVPDPLRTGDRALGLGFYGPHLCHELSVISHSGTSGALAAAVLVLAVLVGKPPHLSSASGQEVPVQKIKSFKWNIDISPKLYAPPNSGCHGVLLGFFFFLSRTGENSAIGSYKKR